MAASQIIFNDLPDGRVEVCVIQRNPDPATPSLAVALARMALAGLGGVIDLRTLGADLSTGTHMVRDKVLPLTVGVAVLVSPPDSGAVDLTDKAAKVYA